MTIDDATIETLINQWFDRNYDYLRLESGHALAPATRETARQEVLFYWRKLRSIATNITDTEVKLNLPFQKTPAGRTFGIEGVVDIIRENDRTVMYDIKTHDADYVRENRVLYARQLNVYAHIWEHLRNNNLDETIIIVTSFPEGLRNAIAFGTPAQVQAEFEHWQPLIPIEFNHDHVRATIADFARIVDDIEDGKFSAPSIDYLNKVFEGTRARFGTRVCRNCDARFSCSAYRQYAGGGRAESRFREYFSDSGDDADREDWLNAALAETPPLDIDDGLPT